MTHDRAATLQSVLALAQGAIQARVRDGTPAAAAMRRVAAALAPPAQRAPGHVQPPAPTHQPACRYLGQAIAGARSGPADLAPLADALASLAPALPWRLRDAADVAFSQGHANATLLGPSPDALAPSDAVRIGMSLMAPGVTYPDHRHPPEEVYLVLSSGEWRQDSSPWHAPGLGGIVYNPPDIVHAMRSAAAPLFAIWCLPLAAVRAVPGTIGEPALDSRIQMDTDAACTLSA